MSNDMRNPTWLVTVLGALNSGGEAAREVLANIMESFLSTPYAVTATTTQLADIAHEVNTSDNKVAGYMVWNSTTGVPVWADGPAAGDTWSDSAGVVDHTPV